MIEWRDRRRSRCARPARAPAKRVQIRSRSACCRLWPGLSAGGVLGLNDERGHLAAAGGHIRQARPAEAREEAPHAPAEEIRREVDQPVALDDSAGLAHRIGLPAD